MNQKERIHKAPYVYIPACRMVAHMVPRLSIFNSDIPSSWGYQVTPSFVQRKRLYTRCIKRQYPSADPEEESSK